MIRPAEKRKVCLFEMGQGGSFPPLLVMIMNAILYLLVCLVLFSSCLYCSCLLLSFSFFLFSLFSSF